MLPYVLNSSGPVLYIIKMNIAIIIYICYIWLKVIKIASF